MEKIHKNPWKWAFFGLLILIIGGMFIAFLMLKSDSEVNNDFTVSKGKTVNTQLVLDKGQINNLANYFLSSVKKDDETNTKFELGDKEAKILGNLTLLNTNVKYSLLFKPEVTDDGNIKLKATNMSIGKLPLPISIVILYIKQKHQTPDWVKIDPTNKTIYLNIRGMNGANGINYDAKKIDMNDDGEFVFDILIPKMKEE